MTGRIYYAIGDVHGELDRLISLHEAIDAHWKAFGEGRPATVLHLGDYVDRGPDSCGVIDYLMMLQSKPDLRKEISIACILGNHERMMLDACDGGEHQKLMQWLMNGGEATIESYRRVAPAGTPLLELVPREHLDWLKALPLQVVDRDVNLLFVHAGVQPDKYPKGDEEVFLWTRSPKFMNDSKWPVNPELDGLTVVHGHTPTDDSAPYSGPRRVNLDTGACYGGPLTAGVFKDGLPPEFLYARKPSPDATPSG
jgi:serine/threonine protein phosphatase 1